MTTGCHASNDREICCGNSLAEAADSVLAREMAKNSHHQDISSLINSKAFFTSRGHSFASTTAGSPAATDSVTTDPAEVASTQAATSLEEVYGSTPRDFSFSEDVVQAPNRASTLFLSSETLLGPASTFFRLRTPQISSSESIIPSTSSPITTRFRSPSALSDAFALSEAAAPSRFETPSLGSDASPSPLAVPTPLSYRRDDTLSVDGLPAEEREAHRSVEPSHSLYKSTSAASETRSTIASPLSWTRLRFASCSEEVRERKPSSAADLISKYESAQSGTYKEYRKWKESKWGEDALDEVEFEDDDVNLELSIPAVFSSPIIQMPSVGEAFQNINERLVGYMISVTDLIVNADYYLKHPRDLWQNATSALWMLLPHPPKYIIDSFISVACESSQSDQNGQDGGVPFSESTTAYATSEQGEFEGKAFIGEQDVDDIAALGEGVPIDTSHVSSETKLVFSIGQCFKWSAEFLIFAVSIFVAFGVLLMTRLYDFGLWCSRLFAIFDTADLVFCQYIPWVSSTSPVSMKHDTEMTNDDDSFTFKSKGD